MHVASYPGLPVFFNAHKKTIVEMSIRYVIITSQNQSGLPNFLVCVLMRISTMHGIGAEVSLLQPLYMPSLLVLFHMGWKIHLYIDIGTKLARHAHSHKLYLEKAKRDIPINMPTPINASTPYHMKCPSNEVICTIPDPVT